ncbi:hypothetical protein BDW75DRAFT_214617 [Aspergillus navahoensis]
MLIMPPLSPARLPGPLAMQTPSGNLYNRWSQMEGLQDRPTARPPKHMTTAVEVIVL